MAVVEVLSNPVRARGTLRLDFNYEVSGAGERKVPYSNTDSTYSPAHFWFTLATSDDSVPPMPRYTHLRFESGYLSGGKIKKDGIPGRAEVNEHFYRAGDLPLWAARLVYEVTAEMKGKN